MIISCAPSNNIQLYKTEAPDLRVDKGLLVFEDSGNLFVDFELEIDNNESTDIAIKFFEDECLNRFNCFGDFSFEEVKENSGEEILFYKCSSKHFSTYHKGVQAILPFRPDVSEQHKGVSPQHKPLYSVFTNNGTDTES